MHFLHFTFASGIRWTPGPSFSSTGYVSTRVYRVRIGRVIVRQAFYRGVLGRRRPSKFTCINRYRTDSILHYPRIGRVSDREAGNSLFYPGVLGRRRPSKFTYINTCYSTVDKTSYSKYVMG